MLEGDPDFLTLTGAEAPAVDRARAPLAAGIMAAVLVPVLAGWLPIAVAAVAGAALVVLTRCISMDDAYHAIEWRAVFLIAGMLPLGIAMQSTGAAAFLTGQLVSAVGDYGPLAVMAGLFLATALGAQVMPTFAVAISSSTRMTS